VNVVLVVGMKVGDVPKVRELSEACGMDVAIILLNAGLDGMAFKSEEQRTFFEESYETVYYYGLRPHPKWSAGILYRKFPENWSVANKGGLMMETLLEKDTRPTMDEIDEVLRKAAEKPSFGKAVSNLFGKK